MNVKFKAKLETVVFVGEKFKIYGMKVDRRKPENSLLKFNKYGNVTIVGDLPEFEYDIEYDIEGTEKYNSSFGYQYQVTSIRRDKPTSYGESMKFLEEVTTTRQAKILLDAYPDIVDRIINNEDVDLSITKGIKEATFEKIREKVIRDFCLLDLINEYSCYGMTLSMIRKLHKKFTSVERVREAMQEDPYDCLCSINGIGFLKADEMILKINSAMSDSIQRCRACMYYILENELEGSTFIARQGLFNRVYNYIGETTKYFDDVLIFSTDIITNEGRVASKVVFETEKYIAEKIMELNGISHVLPIDWTKYCKIGDIELTEQQSGALKNICENKVSILAGFAGAGKTQTTKAIIDMLEDNELTYSLFAPTGKICPLY